MRRKTIFTPACRIPGGGHSAYRDKRPSGRLHSLLSRCGPILFLLCRNKALRSFFQKIPIALPHSARSDESQFCSLGASQEGLPFTLRSRRIRPLTVRKGAL